MGMKLVVNCAVLHGHTFLLVLSKPFQVRWSVELGEPWGAVEIVRGDGQGLLMLYGES